MAFAVLMTKHDKGKVVAPVLRNVGLRVVENPYWDTDQLGTFSGEKARKNSAQECALIKAKKAVEVTGMDIGLGSEGTFGGGPMPGIMNWDEEILCYYQKSTDRVIYAHASGPFNGKTITLRSHSEAMDFVNQAEKEQALNLTVKDEFLKGVFPEQFRALLVNSAEHLTWPLIVEPDLRAMNCPQRREIIQKAAEDLAVRLCSMCPECEAPNYVVKTREAGLPCEQCTLPTQLPLYEVLACDECGHEEKKAVESSQASSQHCALCNP
ncbi:MULTISPECIES: DUF6671 family protein [Gammaproteobacteria]|uniref:DUF6671 family protein n=1 Tax=Gammaproteobacteria TaxID=1236 RepID=UPI000DD06619|nr:MULTISPECIES: DUF6671 family protein [Gammaproteobacteria]RTE86022.1 hypothetical protein DQX04_05465 [Aliidiomarina sp. B3213]TCZ91376.1 hypothetical protein EYQ95_05475 [Lysobacter sp. N42]